MSEPREPAPAPALSDVGSIRPLQIWRDVTARVLQSELITMAVVEIPADGLVPAHQHENEQVGLCLAGSLTFTVGQETGELGPGGMWRILAGVRHEVRAGAGGAVVVEVFSPVRDDWAGLEHAPETPPRWPGGS
ncbi:cupin domain-containing protein [Actinomadura sp. KC345]|uniref:cupin domain-containing protein n=1 Tax=Actinomadura sp. KC345 TaxID=2530371 RepID=UPI001052E778|nr:cupin domain-containing protein [Actinomadura sp. KC345]TDC57141.1 cupin domain-containing protein [Actinomadura sp. KC345]